MNDDPQTYVIIGAAMEVHREMGHGFLEAVCQEALAFELEEKGIKFEREKIIHVRYKGRKLQKAYIADFVCDGEIVVELKAKESLSGVDEAQLLNYLKATGLQRGLLLNFGAASLQHKRMVWNYEH